MEVKGPAPRKDQEKVVKHRWTDTGAQDKEEGQISHLSWALIESPASSASGVRQPKAV